jgi:hypothetical protein
VKRLQVAGITKSMIIVVKTTIILKRQAEQVFPGLNYFIIHIIISEGPVCTL